MAKPEEIKPTPSGNEVRDDKAKVATDADPVSAPAPAKTNEEKVKDTAEQIRKLRDLKVKREEALEKKDKNEIRKIEEAIAKQGKEVKDKVKKVIEEVPELKAAIAPIEKDIKEAADAATESPKKEFPADDLKVRAQELAKERPDEPIAELAVLIIEDEIDTVDTRFREEARQIEIVEKIKTSDLSWNEVVSDLDEAKDEAHDNQDGAQQRVAALEAKQLMLLRDAEVSVPEIIKLKKAIDALEEKSKDNDTDPREIDRERTELGKKADDYDQKTADTNGDNVGMAKFYFEKRMANIQKKIEAKNPQAAVHNELNNQVNIALNEAKKQLDEGKITPEQFEQITNAIHEKRKLLETQMSAEMAPGKYYEPFPEGLSDEEATRWVWEKLDAIDDASIPPSALSSSAAFLSLSNALTNKHLPIHLRDNINAWKSVYEMDIIWDTSGSPTDVLAHASGLGSSAFLGLIGQKVEGQYTEQARMIQKAFAILDRRGYELASPYADAATRAKVHKEIIEELQKNGAKFAKVYEKIAYRYWTFLGREGRFDRVMVNIRKSKKKMDENGEYIVPNDEVIVTRDVNFKEITDKKIIAAKEMTIKKGTTVYGITLDNDLVIKAGQSIIEKIIDTGREKGENQARNLKIIESGVIKKGSVLFSADREYDYYVPLGDIAKNLIDQKPNNKRADGYTKSPIKFWYRRLLPNGLYQEKNITYLPTMFDALGNEVTDFFTGKIFLDKDKTKEPDSGDDKCVENITEEMLAEGMDWENSTGGFSTWIDDFRKSADTRKELLRPGGILETPIIDPRNISKVKEVFETIANKKETKFVDIVDAYIEEFKDRGLLSMHNVEIPIVRDGKVVGTHNIWARSKIQEETGLSLATMDREGIENFIDVMAVQLHFLTAAQAEYLKRKHLSFLGMQGRGSVRLLGFIAEKGPRGLLGMLFAMLGEFWNVTVGSSLSPGPSGGSGGKKR